MTDREFEVEEGSLALAVTMRLIEFQIETGRLTREEAETVLNRVVEGAGIPIAQQGAYRRLKRDLPGLNIAPPAS